MNSASMNIGVHVSCRIIVLSGYIPKSGETPKVSQFSNLKVFGRLVGQRADCEGFFRGESDVGTEG